MINYWELEDPSPTGGPRHACTLAEAPFPYCGLSVPGARLTGLPWSLRTENACAECRRLIGWADGASLGDAVVQDPEQRVLHQLDLRSGWWSCGERGGSSASVVGLDQTGYRWCEGCFGTR
jgi:hypothetical protein